LPCTSSFPSPKAKCFSSGQSSSTSRIRPVSSNLGTFLIRPVSA